MIVTLILLLSSEDIFFKYFLAVAMSTIVLFVISVFVRTVDYRTVNRKEESEFAEWRIKHGV